jgi:hypothetical protein
MSYNYNPKVTHPNKIFLQMTSGGFQTPFFFGGSQVPVDLGLITPKHPFEDLNSNRQLVGYGFLKGKQHKRVNLKIHR